MAVNSDGVVSIAATVYPLQLTTIFQKFFHWKKFLEIPYYAVVKVLVSSMPLVLSVTS